MSEDHSRKSSFIQDRGDYLISIVLETATKLGVQASSRPAVREELLKRAQLDSKSVKSLLDRF